MTTRAVRLPPADPSTSDRRPGLARLTAVELRKMVDTLAGFWLLATILLLTLAVVVVVAFVGTPRDRTLQLLTEAAIAPASILLPVVGILLVTSEWSQRTALVTFALVPQRGRVLTAKAGAAVVSAVIVLVAGFLLAVVTTAAAGSDHPDVWELPVRLAGQMTLAVAVAMLMGLAFGAALLNTPLAIVLYFVLPTVWSGLGEIEQLEGAASWLDTAETFAPLTDHLLSADEWARVGTTAAVWILIPAMIGLWRMGRREVS